MDGQRVEECGLHLPLPSANYVSTCLKWGLWGCGSGLQDEVNLHVRTLTVMSLVLVIDTCK